MFHVKLPRPVRIGRDSPTSLRTQRTAFMSRFPTFVHTSFVREIAVPHIVIHSRK